MNYKYRYLITVTLSVLLAYIIVEIARELFEYEAQIEIANIGLNKKFDTNAVLRFIFKEKYKYTQLKKDIPREVIEIISKAEKDTFKVGDKLDTNIYLSCVRIIGVEGFEKRLNFALINDTNCIIGYTCGGFVSHETIDFVKYKGTSKHLRYVPYGLITDTSELKEYMRWGFNNYMRDSAYFFDPLDDRMKKKRRSND